MMAGKTYSLICIVGLIGLLSLAALFNRIVDPFWYYRDISIPGFNQVKTQFQHYERHIKPVILKETQPEVVIFGSSYFEIGFNPAHPGLTQNGALRSYNFGMAATDWERLVCNVEYALNNTELKTVVIGLLARPLPRVDCSKKFKTMGQVKQTSLLFSFDALKASYKTVTRQNRAPTHNLQGLFYFHRDNSGIVESVFKNDFYRYRLQNEACKPQGISDMPPWSYPDARQDVEGLRSLLKRLIERGVQVKLVVYPFHALWLELAMNCRGNLDRWHTLYQFAQVVDELNQGKHGIELWDFQGFAGFFTEEIRNNHVKYWQDTGHFNYEMGDVMLDAIFHGDAADRQQGDEFGVLLTAESVPARYARFAKNRMAFIQANPGFAEAFAQFQ